MDKRTKAKGLTSVGVIRVAYEAELGKPLAMLKVPCDILKLIDVFVRKQK